MIESPMRQLCLVREKMTINVYRALFYISISIFLSIFVFKKSRLPRIMSSILLHTLHYIWFKWNYARKNEDTCCNQIQIIQTFSWQNKITYFLLLSAVAFMAYNFQSSHFFLMWRVDFYINILTKIFWMIRFAQQLFIFIPPQMAHKFLIIFLFFFLKQRATAVYNNHGRVRCLYICTFSVL